MTTATNGPPVVNGGANNYDRAVCFDAPVAMDTGLYAPPEKTLLQLCQDMMVRMGYAAMIANPPPGMLIELKSYLQDAQEQLYVRYDTLRTERWWAWQLTPGRAVYDTPIDCTKALNFRKITGAYIVDNGGRALRMFAGGSDVTAGTFLMPSTPTGFEYEVTTAGTLGTDEPLPPGMGQPGDTTWPATADAIVTSGTAVLTARKPASQIWQTIHQGINPLNFGSPRDGYPTSFELREYVEVWPVPTKTMVLWLKGHLGLKRFTEDDDVPTIDGHAVFLYALANAKAFRGQSDAGNYAQAVTRYLTELVAGSHGVRRYIPRASTAGMKYDACGPWPLPIGTWR